ncbi:MAG: RNA methyltransferase [Bryobacterales bacterium]|nr:RNA methyltransferase [Bryobacterales bacterium]
MARVQTLSSSANPLLKEIRRAVRAGTLTRDGCCVAETFHLLEEALRSDCRIRAVLVAESVRAAVESHLRGLSGPRLVVLPDRLFQGIASTETSQGILALVQPPQWTLPQLCRPRSLVVVLDGLQDPGNAGAILRAAEAFGATGVLALKGTVSLYNPKAVRASAGSLFRVPAICGMEESPALAWLEQQGLELYAASPTGRHLLGETDLTRDCALIIGSEGRGVRPKLRAAAKELRIPTRGVESLNAAMAATVLLYEASRQRTSR